MHRTRLAPLVALALCLCANAQEDVADVEFKDRAELHAAAPAIGTVVSDLVLVSLEGRPVALTSLRGQTVVLIRAGYTSQPFRDAIQGLTEQHQRYADSRDVAFLVVVDADPEAKTSPLDSIAQNLTLADRRDLGARMRDELGITLPIHLAGTDDTTRAHVANLVAPVVVLDPRGRIVDKLPSFEPDPLARAVERSLRKEPPVVFPNHFQSDRGEREATLQRAARDPDRVLRAAWGQAEYSRRTESASNVEATARLALARVALCRYRSRDPRMELIEIADRAAEAAWEAQPQRLLAARIQLAEEVESIGAILAWRPVLETMPEGTEPFVRAWVESQRDRLEAPLLAFAPENRKYVERRLRERPQTTDLNLGCFHNCYQADVGIVRARFDETEAVVVQDSRMPPLRKGTVLFGFDRAKRYAMPPVGSERWVLATSFRWVSGSTHSEQPMIAER